MLELVTYQPLNLVVLLDHGYNLILQFFVIFDNILDSEMTVFVHFKQSVPDLVDCIQKRRHEELKWPDLFPVLDLYGFLHLLDVKVILEISKVFEDVANPSEVLAELLFKRNIPKIWYVIFLHVF